MDKAYHIEEKREVNIKEAIELYKFNHIYYSGLYLCHCCKQPVTLVNRNNPTPVQPYHFKSLKSEGHSGDCIYFNDVDNKINDSTSKVKFYIGKYENSTSGRGKGKPSFPTHSDPNKSTPSNLKNLFESQSFIYNDILETIMDKRFTINDRNNKKGEILLKDYFILVNGDHLSTLDKDLYFTFYGQVKYWHNEDSEKRGEHIRISFEAARLNNTETTFRLYKNSFPEEFSMILDKIKAQDNDNPNRPLDMGVFIRAKLGYNRFVAKKYNLYDIKQVWACDLTREN